MGCPVWGSRTNSQHAPARSPFSQRGTTTPRARFPAALFLHGYNPVRGSSLQSSYSGYQWGPWAVT